MKKELKVDETGAGKRIDVFVGDALTLLRAKLKALWQLPKADGVLFKSLMVNPAHRGHGLSVCLTKLVWSAARDLGYTRCHHVLMHEHNSSLEYSKRGGTELARRYAVYELPLEARA